MQWIKLTPETALPLGTHLLAIRRVWFSHDAWFNIDKLLVDQTGQQIIWRSTDKISVCFEPLAKYSHYVPLSALGPVPGTSVEPLEQATEHAAPEEPLLLEFAARLNSVLIDVRETGSGAWNVKVKIDKQSFADEVLQDLATLATKMRARVMKRLGG